MAQPTSVSELVRMRVDGDVTGLCRAARARDPGIARQAVQLLGGVHGSPEAVEGLVACLQWRGEWYPGFGMRWQAAKSLGKLRERRAVPQLLRLLADERENSEQPAGFLCAALVSIGGPEAVRGLVGMCDELATGRGYWTMQVLDALAALRPPEAVTPLLATLWEWLPGRAKRVVRTLGAIGDRRATSALLVLAHTPAPGTHLRRAAVTALHALPGVDWSSAHRWPPAETLLHAPQRDPDPETARLATALLARTEDGRAHLWNVLRTASHTPHHPEAPPHAVAAVCARVAAEPGRFAVPDPGEHHALLRHHLRESAVPAVRRAAARALSAYAGADAGEALLTALGDAHIGDTVADLVARLPEPPSPRLRTLLTDTDRPAAKRCAAARALGVGGCTEAASTLVTVVADGAAPAVVRASAADALGTLRHRASAAPLAALAGDEEQPGTVRARAVRALGLIGAPGTLPVVLACARSPHEAVRARAVAALGAFPVAESAQALGEFVTRSTGHGGGSGGTGPRGDGSPVTGPHGTGPRGAETPVNEPQGTGPDLARVALDALGRIGAPALPVLVALADSAIGGAGLGDDLADRLVAALAACPEAEATAALMRLAASPPPPAAAMYAVAGRLSTARPVRETASLALTERGTPECLSPLTSLLVPEAWHGAREPAVRALLSVGTDEAYEHVLAYCLTLTELADWHVEALAAVAGARARRR